MEKWKEMKKKAKAWDKTNATNDIYVWLEEISKEVGETPPAKQNMEALVSAAVAAAMKTAEPKIQVHSKIEEKVDTDLTPKTKRVLATVMEHIKPLIGEKRTRGRSLDADFDAAGSRANTAESEKKTKLIIATTVEAAIQAQQDQQQGKEDKEKAKMAVVSLSPSHSFYPYVSMTCCCSV